MHNNARILITGGCGFIGSAVVRYLIQETSYAVVNLDKLTYAGNMESLSEVSNSCRYSFEQTDIADKAALSEILLRYQPDAIMHLAAESHVDRSIDGPDDFIQSNIVGTYSLLEASRSYWSNLPHKRKQAFRFHHISTDEVYGDLHNKADFFVENTPYAPSSPYSASKAASDHLVRAWQRTYCLPAVITNCSNNYGPCQFPEKLIPHMILNALQGKPLPVYGLGQQIRDWLYVEDHVRALIKVTVKGRVGETYNIGGRNEHCNLDVVEAVCALLEELAPESKPREIKKYCNLITFVKDRPGHDARYAIDASKIEHELGWTPQETFETGLRKTVLWYLENKTWWHNILSGVYRLTRIGTDSERSEVAQA